MMQNNQNDAPTGNSTPQTSFIHRFINAHTVNSISIITSTISDLKNTWIVDSDATDHITISLNHMYDIYTCDIPIFVTLPNGFNAKVT